jgi:hypothetical protein
MSRSAATKDEQETAKKREWADPPSLRFGDIGRFASIRVHWWLETPEHKPLDRLAVQLNCLKLNDSWV